MSNGVLNVLDMAMRLNVGTNGKLVDDQGLEVSGIVHKNEYVILEWMRPNPEVLQVEDWLEARRLRGYAQGGNTTDSDRRVGDLSVVGQADLVAATTQQLVQVLASLDQRQQGVEQWATQLEVVNDLIGLNRELDKVKKVQNSSAVTPTAKPIQ